VTAAFDALKPKITAEYHRLWPICFEGHGIPERACVFVCEKAKPSGYFRKLDVILIFVVGWDVDDPYGGPHEWPRWRGELVHELVHEFEWKVKPEATEQGRELFASQPAFDEDGNEHGPVFYTSVVAIAERLGIGLEELLHVL
jgi:hypothetical protein